MAKVLRGPVFPPEPEMCWIRDGVALWADRVNRSAPEPTLTRCGALQRDGPTTGSLAEHMARLAATGKRTVLFGRESSIATSSRARAAPFGEATVAALDAPRGSRRDVRLGRVHHEQLCADARLDRAGETSTSAAGSAES